LQRFPDLAKSFGVRLNLRKVAQELAEPRAVAKYEDPITPESHLVELDDGSKWQIFPGDLDVTLNWQPDTELKLVRIDDPASSHALVSGNDNSSVRVLPVEENWPVDEVRTVLRDS
jgi:hypothetical protein